MADLSLRCVIAIILAFTAFAASASPADDDKAQGIVHMLDYVGVDYPGAVKDGKAIDESEYKEQREFASQAAALLQQLPEAPERAAVVAAARKLVARIDAKAPGEEVSKLARGVREDVIRVYQLAVAPRAAPDLAKAATLFQANCAACHGAQGLGDGPLAKGLDPHPSNFHNRERMDKRSVYGLYNTITLGVHGTAMRPFSELAEGDRWALAFLAAGFRAPQAEVARGEQLWKAGTGQKAYADYKPLVLPAPEEVAARGADEAAVHAYLIAHPQAIAAAAPSPLKVTRTRLAESMAALKQGDREGARRLAIAAYLEGFELVESALNNVDASLRVEAEHEMIDLRAAIADGRSPEAIGAQVDRILVLLDRADSALSGGEGLSPSAAFLSSLIILLREGLEAVLVLAAISAFVIKTGRRDAMPYVHAGWMLAVVLGIVTWFVATRVVTMSGASREMTEAVTAFIAAVMLLYVGYWLHSKSYAQAWQNFVREQVSAALGRNTVWAMAGVSFIAVYRELFEIVLFYETLWLQAGDTGRHAVLAGIGVAALLLAALTWAILKFSARLPIGPFFTATSALLVVMAVAFVGNGIKALQEAGAVHATLVNFVNWPVLGIYPTVEGLSSQVVVLAAIAAVVMATRRKMRVAT